MLQTVLENKDCKLVMSDVTAKLLQVEQRSQTGGASKPAGGQVASICGGRGKETVGKEGCRVLPL